MKSKLAARLAGAAIGLCAAFAIPAQTTQQHIHRMSHHVMPFDMSKTVHVFRMTDAGGIQQVLVRNAADADQIVLIRRHLKHEAENFRRGDYADPAHLHGAAMPGLKDLQANAKHIHVSYRELPLGAQIKFETKSRHLLTAIHRWFGAQLSEHGADARAE